MDLNQLKSFVAVAHQGNLTQAAETLHLSQPAVSAQIKAIEKNLNVTLFERNAQGMSLTPSGTALLPRAEMMLQQMHQLDQFALSLAEDYAGQLDLGLIHPLPGRKTAALIRHLQHNLPHIQINCHYGLSGDIINAVRKKELHAGFFIGSNPYRNVRERPLETLEYVVAVAETRLPELAANLPKSLGSTPWLDMSGFSGSHKQMQKLWRELRITPPTPVLCNHPNLLLDMVAAGIGLALVPRRDVNHARARGMAITTLPAYTQAMPLSFVYADEFEQDPMVEALKNSLDTVWAA